MKSRQLSLLALVVLLVTPLTVGAAELHAEKSMELPDAPFDRTEHFARMTALQSSLNRGAVSIAFGAPLEIRVSPERLRGVRQQATEAQKMRVGVVTDLAIPVTFTRERIAPRRAMLHDTLGAVRGNDGGGFEWTAVLRSPGAAAVRVGFSEFDLPEGAELYAFSDNGMAFGPYVGRGPNGDGEFWTNSIAGEEIVLELRAGPAGAPRFTIGAFGHMTPDFAIAGVLAPRPEAAEPNCTFNEDCVVGANCVTTNSAVNTAKDAVAHILFASGGWLYICSGGLVADSDDGTNIPYFVTANHCISRASEASSLETFFFYEAPCGSCPDPGSASTTGATISATGKTSDYTLLRLSQNAPSGAAFLGWSSTAVANSNNTPLYRISHPQGAPQSYSEQVVDTSKGVCRSWPRGNWIYSRDTLGATEGGSSGSPVVNAAGQLVGQLSGGCGTNVNDVCDDVNNATVDGAFAAYYANVASILGSGGGGGGGGGGCTDADGDGVCVSQGDCNDNNASIYPGANDTKGKPGRDGIDNDCDGIIDG
jgi:V8-like Glu-specific endopeptidase